MTSRPNIYHVTDRNIFLIKIFTYKMFC